MGHVGRLFPSLCVPYPPHKRLTTMPYLWMLTAAFSFATMGSLVRALADRTEWPIVLLIRSVIILLVVFGLARAAKVPLVFWKPRSLWIRSGAGSAGMLAGFYAMSHLPIADAITIIHMFPLWVALLSWPLFGHWPSIGVWLAIGLGIVGVVVLQQPQIRDGNLATLMAVVCSLAAAFALTGIHLLRHVDPRAVVVHFALVSVPVACVAILVICPSEFFNFRPNRITLLMLLGVGGCATIGQLSMTCAFAAAVPARVSVVALSQVAIAMLYDSLIWDRTFGSVDLFGIGIIVASTAWMMLQDVSNRYHRDSQVMSSTSSRHDRSRVV